MKPPRIAAPLALLVCALVAASSRADTFVFAALPDTQVYAENRFPGDGRNPPTTEPRGTGAIFYDQTEWLRDNEAALDIRYVVHLGDIVQNGDDLDEWALGKDAMDVLLDADLPHGTVMGNHDDNHVGFYAQNYLDNFGPQVFQGRPWYVASSPNGGANFQLLEHGYYKIGFLNFSIDHPQEEIDWAQQIVADNPDTIFIIGTHRYLFDFKLVAGRYGEPLGIGLPADPIAAVPEPNDAEELFNEFVTAHPNILMIHAGHFHSEWLRLDGQNSAAQTVLQILTDYQSTRNGGDGYLRIYELDFEAGTFRFDTYSPTLDRERTTIDHYVETIFLGWAERDAVMDVLGMDEEQYLVFVEAVFGQNAAVPDGFLLQHPDFDEESERAYYEQYLADLFSNEPDVPAQFLDIAHWESLWIVGFAKDPADPFDFADWVRSPRQTLDVDFSAYFSPSPEQELAMAFEELSEAIAELEPDDYAGPRAARWLRLWTERTRRLAEKGRTEMAKLVLRVTLLSRLDGCALRGEPDTSPVWPDLIDNCDAQGPVYDAALEVAELLDGLP